MKIKPTTEKTGWWRRETPKRRAEQTSCLLLRAALAVEALRLVVEGGALLDGDEALAAERLAGLGDGREPAAELLHGSSALLLRNDLSLSVRSRGEASYKNIRSFVDSLCTRKDILKGKPYSFPSHVLDTVVLFSREDTFVSKLSMRVGPDSLLELQPFLWLPEKNTKHRLRLEFHPGTYVFEVLINPVMFIPKIRFDSKCLPQPRHGSLNYTVTWELTPCCSEVQ